MSDEHRPESEKTRRTEGGSSLRSIPFDDFVRRLRADTLRDKRFAFFLGAGCSVSSGIPDAAPLVRDYWIPRLRDHRAPNRRDLDVWARETIEGYDPDHPGRSYGTLIDELFLTAEDRQQEIENLCEGRTPSFGYATLAQLIASPEGRFNVVLTTNFDDLVADSLYLYTEARPLVIHHHSLAAYIRPTRTRPLVVKLHGDHRLSPKNTALETKTIEQELQKHTEMVLHDRGIIFMGYGGADTGIMKLMNDLPPEALPYGAYWVHPHQPFGPVREWLSSREGVWVQSGLFDEVMLLVYKEFEFDHPSKERFEKIFRNYHETYEKLCIQVEAKSAGEPGFAALQAAVTKTDARFPDFWKVISEAARLERTDPDRAQEVYSEGVKQFPQAAPLLGNYAVFLKSIRKDYDAAEAMYKRALVADPKHANSLGNYGNFLRVVRKDNDAAEAMYRRALEADPRHANNLTNYGFFLSEVRKDYDAAEAMYKRALEADPKNANCLGSYALFLQDVRKDYDAAEAMCKRALEADPKNAINLGNYALFLRNVRKDYDAAEAMYKRALEADPKNANCLGGYANFLSDVRKDYDAAEAMYKRALEADPKNANNLRNYAIFLNDDRKDYDAAEAMYKRALEADPKNANCLGGYANFLSDVRKDYDAAEAMYKRALEADPKHANNLANYSRLLLANGAPAGRDTLRRAIDLLRDDPVPPVELECGFYLFAHGAEDQRFDALRTIRKLVNAGVRSPGWDLSRNVERALVDKHPEGAWLDKLASVINSDAQPESLDDWPAWKSAGA